MTPFQLTTNVWFNRAKPNPQLSDMMSYQESLPGLNIFYTHYSYYIIGIN